MKEPSVFQPHSFDNPVVTDFGIYLLQTIKPDVIHFCHILRVGEFALSARQMQIPYLVTLTDYTAVCPSLFAIKKDMQPCYMINNDSCATSCQHDGLWICRRDEAIRNLLVHAKSVFTPSAFTMNRIQDKMQLENMQINSHGLNFLRCRPHHKKCRTLVRFGFIGGISFHKGIDVLIDALQYVKNPMNEFVFYGIEPDDDLVQCLFANINPLVNFKIMGCFSHAQLEEVFASFDVLIVPSLTFESFSYVLHESIFFKTPFVGSHIGVIPEIIDNFSTGFLFPPGDAKALGNIMNLCIDYPVIVQNFSKQLNEAQVKSVEEEYAVYETFYQNKKTTVDNTEMAQHFDSKTNQIFQKFPDITLYSYKKLQQRLNMVGQRFPQQKVDYYIWGTGASGAITLHMISECLPNFRCLGYIDSYSEGTKDGYKIYKPNSEILTADAFYFVCSSYGRKDISKQLMQENLFFMQNYSIGYL